MMSEKERLQYEKLVLTPVEKLIPKLAVPTIISMMITMIYNLVDAYFVGKLGTSASAAIGIVLGVQSIIQAFGFMLGHGAGSQISVHLGQGDRDAADRLLSTAFFTAAGFSILLTVICLIGLAPLMRLMGSTDTILPYSSTYAVYILLSGPALMCSCVLNNVMRYEGKAVLAMAGLVTGGVLNMVGDPILMFGLGLGIDGAGLSTAVSQYISFGILLYMFLSHRSISRISIRYFSRDYRDLLRILRVGFPSLIRQMLNSISTMALNNCAMPYGDAAIAAMSIVGRITMFIYRAAGNGYSGYIGDIGNDRAGCCRTRFPGRSQGCGDRRHGAAFSVRRCIFPVVQYCVQYDVPERGPQQGGFLSGDTAKRSFLYTDPPHPAPLSGTFGHSERTDVVGYPHYMRIPALCRPLFQRDSRG